MKLTNLSDRIINVGTQIVLPGGVINIKDEMAETPSLKALVNFNLIALAKEENKEAVEVHEEAPEEDSEEVNATTEDEEKPKRGRKASK